ncbi:HAUS1 protein, partial [Nyctiprogne leucopyga]|nr:HAUS1 protein [Nyctiprogne leucopyga]
QVILWLKKIYGNQPIPEYEVNARTVDILYELAEHNEARDRDVSLLIENVKQRATEYEAKANYLQGLLIEGFGLSMSSLSSEGFSCLNALVNSAVILEMKDTSLTSFFCAINHMTAELYATKSENKKLEVELNNMSKKLTAALLLETRLKEDLKKSEEIIEIETDNADSQIYNLKFLEDKSKDMNLRIKAAEKQLAATGLDQSLTHEALVNMSE